MSSELTSVKRLGWSPYLGAYKSLVYVTLLGRRVKVQDFWAPAVEAMNTALVEAGYENPCDWTGSYYKRTISGTDIWSWHSYGGAIDLDYGGDNPDSPDHPLIDRNPHLHRRIPWGDPGFGTEFQLTEHQVKAVLAIRTTNGKQVWRWLGTAIGDTMHFEPNCTPYDISTGIGDEIVAENKKTSNPQFQPAWDKAIETGFFSEYTKPEDIVTAEKLAVFLHRAKLL